MREVRYQYNTLGAYQTSDNTAFGDDTQLKFIVEPHDFSLAIGGETLRKSACDGYEIQVSRRGEVVFYNSEGNMLAKADEDGRDYKEARMKWSQNAITVQFGQMETIDHYPNCDGESDRYSTRWSVYREVSLNAETNEITIRPKRKQMGDTMRNIDPNKPMLALTFDDGPCENTERLLYILKQYNAKATFFLLGYKIDRGQSTLLRLIAEGHEIGNHTWDHPRLTELSDDEIRAQITSTNAKIHEVTKIGCKIVRPPFCAYDDKVQKIGEELGVSFVNCSINSDDWNTTDPQVVYTSVVDRAKDRTVILCHDKYPSTIEAMERIIPKLIENGYQLVTVSELFQHADIELEPGKLYP